MRVCEICGAKHHALGLCRKHYDQQRNRSENKICPGCNQKTLTRKASLCGSCSQRAIRGTLRRKLRLGSGGEILAIWDNASKGWKIADFEVNKMDSRKFRQDVITQHYTRAIRREYYEQNAQSQSS